MRIKVRALAVRGLPAVVLASAAIVAGCGSDDDSGNDSASANQNTTQTDKPEASGGIAKAQEEAKAAQDIPGAPFEVAPLEKPPPKDLHVAYVTCTLPQCAQDAATEPGEALGWTVDTVPYDVAKGPTDEIRGMRQAIQKGAKYIVFSSAFDPKAMAPAFKEAKEKGVRLASFGYPGPPDDNVEIVIAGPPYFGGLSRLAAVGAIADAGGKTVIGYAREPSIPAYKTVAFDGVKEAVDEYGEGTEIKTTDYSAAAPPAQTVAGFVNFIRRNPDVKYFITPNPAAFAGLPQALRQANLADKVKLIVVEPQSNDIKSIKNGEVWMGSAGENHSFLYRAMDVFARMENGEELTEEQTFGFGWARLITKDNVGNVTGTSATPEGDPVPDNFQAVYKKAWGIGG